MYKNREIYDIACKSIVLTCLEKLFVILFYMNDLIICRSYFFIIYNNDNNNNNNNNKHLLDEVEHDIVQPFQGTLLTSRR